MKIRSISCLFVLAAGIMLSPGVIANPMPIPEIFIENGPGFQDVSIIEACVWGISGDTGYSSCLELDVYRDGKKITCDLKDYTPDGETKYSYTPDETGDLDVQEDEIQPRDVVDRDDAIKSPNDSFHAGYLRCIDKCVPLGVHHYQLKGINAEGDVDKSITISLADPACTLPADNMPDTKDPREDAVLSETVFKDSGSITDHAGRGGTSDCATSSTPGNVGWLLLIPGLLLFFKRPKSRNLKIRPGRPEK